MVPSDDYVVCDQVYSLLIVASAKALGSKRYNNLSLCLYAGETSDTFRGNLASI